MMARTHLLFGASVWLFCAQKWHLPAGFQGFVGLCVATFSALLPDIDHPSSILGRKLPFVSQPLSRLVGHRGVTHSLFAVALMGSFFLWEWIRLKNHVAGIDSWHFWIGLPLTLGYLSHLLGDMMTPSGVPFFWPSRVRVRMPLTFPTNGFFESLLQVFLMTWIVLSFSIQFLGINLFPWLMRLFKWLGF